MSRAEEKAKVFGNSLGYYRSMEMWPEEAFQKGYEQAEKDTIERAVDWLKTRTFMFDSTEQIDLFIDLFRQAMEEEQ